ncbi:MAG: 30S ribosomal protein S3ae [Aigarchaeota archaeon]|nr:30S ribosomal protein S3ae [Aigarchaeota archaeon]MDW8092453.1 30S ribosomal protein S3ae [Nitrososphaerota archaeon]
MSKREGAVKEKKVKREYVIMSPEYFGKRELGTTVTDDPGKLVNRTVQVSLYNLTDDFSKQYLLIKFKVIRVRDSIAETVFYGHEYGREFLRSLVRRGTSKIDGYYNLETVDGGKFRVQSTVFTYRVLRRGKRTQIRHVMERVLKETASRLTFDQLAQELVLGKTASDIYNSITKILLPRHVGIVKSKVLSLPPSVVRGEVATREEVEVRP